MNRDYAFCVAPMLDCTDRHDRYLLRLISRHARLYTEMVTTGAIIYGDRDRFLRFDPTEHPIALQLGGSDPNALAECARIAEDRGYDEVNLNVGCPSNRVQSGQFGACLMAKPELVAECVDAMRTVVSIPVTVKHRVGIDDLDSYEHLHHFVTTVAHAGCDIFILHARKAILNGLSPKDNRTVPPLRYDMAAQLKQDFPQLQIILNGGIEDIEQAKDHLNTFDGVMLGRAAYHNPYMLSRVDREIFNEDYATPDRQEIVQAYLSYLQDNLDEGVPLPHMARHLIGLYKGTPGAKSWRRVMSEDTRIEGANISTIERSLIEIEQKIEHAKLRNSDYTLRKP